MTNSDFDVGIIGGGPAGSSAALLLARNGFRVLVIEKKVFPREVLCGEFLSNEVIQFLKDQSLFDEFLSLHPNPITSFKFKIDSKSITSKLGFTSYGLKRSKFDQFLLQKAEASGAKIIQPAEVKSINRIEDNYKLIISGTEKKISEIIVKDLIAAYGKQNILDKNLSRNFLNKKSNLNGIKFHIGKKYLNSFNEEEIQIFSSEGIYCGLNAVDYETVTVCFLENRNKTRLSPRQQIPELMIKNKSFSKIFNDDLHDFFNNVKIYGTGNIYFGKRNLIENGIYMIGDAAAVIAPLAGDGIGMAIESAKIIASLIVKQRYENLDKLYIEQWYIKSWHNRFNKRIKTARIIQKIILKKVPRSLGFKVVYNFPSLLPALIKLTRN